MAALRNFVTWLSTFDRFTYRPRVLHHVRRGDRVGIVDLYQGPCPRAAGSAHYYRPLRRSHNDTTSTHVIKLSEAYTWTPSEVGSYAFVGLLSNAPSNT